ncbi:MAG: potassium transporter TrkG, partial [Bacilli bacterium]
SFNARTAGFATVDFNLFSSFSILVVIMLFFIGASPASTGGGIKTTTFYTIIKSIGSYARGKKPISYNRKISEYSITKAFVLVSLSLIIIVITIGIISFIERYNGKIINDYNYFMKIVFESFSAFGTVGNSMGITKDLHWLSKWLLSMLMLFGRLGPITIISLWNSKSAQINNDKIKYLDQKMFIG